MRLVAWSFEASVVLVGTVGAVLGGCGGSASTPDAGAIGSVDAGSSPVDASAIARDVAIMLGQDAQPMGVDTSPPPDAALPWASAEALLVDQVIEAPGATGEGLRDPHNAVNGVRGAGASQGSFDVYSLDYASSPYLVLGLGDRRVFDGPGAELAVFENPFDVANSDVRFMDQVVVSVSRDGSVWVPFAVDYVSAIEETVYVGLPSAWRGFAGVTPVLLHAEDNVVDPFDAAAAGGDRFDLADLVAGPEADAIRAEGVRFVRLESAARVVNPDTGAPFVRDGTSTGPDIDGVYARYLSGR